MASTSKQSTKLFIPVATPNTNDKNVVLCGVLEQVDPGVPTRGRRVALILHGVVGHKDYLFLKRLALQLPMDSFRFDFRGCHESTGRYHVLGLDSNVEDITAAVAYLTTQHGYIIDLIVAHSRAVVDAFRWICTAEEGKSVRGFVNISGRYRMTIVYDGIEPADRESLNSRGFYTIRGAVNRRAFECSVTEADLADFALIDTSLVWDHFPIQTHVLSMHGLQDRVVPPFDATIYARALGSRFPGTHNLHYVEEGDHNFAGLSHLVVSTIFDWLQQLEQGRLKTGIWQSGIRGKL